MSQPKPRVKRLPNGGAWAGNEDMHMSMACPRRPESLTATPSRELQCTSMMWGGQLPP